MNTGVEGEKKINKKKRVVRRRRRDDIVGVSNVFLIWTTSGMFVSNCVK